MAARYLQIEDNFECHGMDVVIYEESDVPQPYKIGAQPPPKSPPTWAWGFDDKGGVETVWLGFTTKDAAISDAWAYRRSILEDYD